MNMGDLATATAPEIGLTVVALAVLLVDVTFLRAWPTARRATWLGYLTALGLAGVLLVISQQLAAPTTHFADPARIFIVNRLSLTLQGLLVVLTVGTVLISMSYEFTQHVGEYFCVTVFACVGMCFLVATENLLMFLVALELLSVCLYILTAFHKGLLRSAEAALKYFLFGALSSAFLLFGLSYVVGVTGAVHVNEIAAAVHAQLAQSSTPPLLLVVGLLFTIVGIGFKIAVVPFHLWAPDAYEGAPTPVGAFIATGSKVASFVVGAKILLLGFPELKGSALWLHWQPGWALILAVIATASMVWGNVAAIAQTNVKRLLAYSSVAHAGYILIGIIASTSMGTASVLFYLVAYSLTNLGAFGVVAALTRAAGGDDLEDFDGMAQRAPGMSLLLLVFVLSLAGIPPLAGFFAKLYVFAAAVGADQPGYGLLWLVVVAVGTSAVSLYYYLLLLKHVYVHAPKRAGAVAVPLYLRVTLTLVAVAVVLLGVLPQTLLQTFIDLVAADFG